MHLIIIAVAALGGFVQTITGFGTGVILMAFLPHFFDLFQAPALSVSICLGFNFIVLYQYRKFIEWKKVILPMILYIGSSTIVINLEGDWNLDVLNIIFGLFLVAMAVYFLFIAKNAELKGTTGTAVACSTASGICAGLFGIGGPPLALYFVQVTEDHPHYMANMHVIFALNSLLSMILRISHGYYPMNLLPLTLLGFVGVLIGKEFGRKVAGKLDTATFKKIVYTFVGLSGIATLAEHLF